ncbi:hypothetical protein T492DRAFT_860943 [Pavlovales sp. CCMP2436]|nr:hypothetical protein T492DRAFT_860943 [Pavlovales sp. CCMP2436]
MALHVVLSVSSLAVLAVCFLSAAVNAAPVPNPNNPNELRCRLKKIAMDMPAVEYSTDGEFQYSNPVDALLDTDSGEVVMLKVGKLIASACNDPNGYEEDSAVESTFELLLATRKSFGGERRAMRGHFAQLPGGRGHGRRLQATGGAAPVDYSAFHGDRRILSVIVGASNPGNGDVASWQGSCTVASVQQLMWGLPDDGVRFTVGASPWAQKAQCKYNIRDHMSGISRAGVQFKQALSVELFLPVVLSWPTNYCSFWQDIDAVNAAVDAHGQYDVANFDHATVFGRYAVVNMCPSSYRANSPIIVATELGHNLGLHHSGIMNVGEYSDYSSMMGSIERLAVLNASTS